MSDEHDTSPNYIVSPTGRTLPKGGFGAPEHRDYRPKPGNLYDKDGKVFGCIMTEKQMAESYRPISPRFPTIAEANERRRQMLLSRITVIARFCFALFCIGFVTMFMRDMGTEAKWSMIVGGFGFLACCIHFVVTDTTDHWKR